MAAEKRLTGQATPEGTRRFAEDSNTAAGFHREARGLQLSSLGMGTYLGEVSEEASLGYRRAAVRAIERGINVFDAAINYRDQASERDVGSALRESGVDRQEVFLVTKGGFLHGDAPNGKDARAYMTNRYLSQGKITIEDIVAGVHCMAPGFLRGELAQSLDNLGVEHVDLYLVHNPETQLTQGVPPDAFDQALLEAFTELERQRDQGTIGGYGVATWEALRVDPEHPAHMGLEHLLDIAEQAHDAADVSASEHGFVGVQLPLNLAMPEAAGVPTQPWEGEQLTALEAANQAGLIVLTSASLCQARLLGSLTHEARELLDADDDLQAALTFARSAPGVTTALVGMGQVAHVDENLEAISGREIEPSRVRKLLDHAEIHDPPETT